MKILKSVGMMVLLLSIWGCNTQVKEDNSEETPTSSTDNLPLVVATTSILCDLTQQVAQDTVNLKCLLEPEVDPHVYQATPEDRQAIESADLVLYGGYNFDSSLIKLIDATTNSNPKIAVHEVAVKDPLLGEEHDHGHGDHSEEKHSEKDHDDHDHKDHDDHDHDDHKDHDDHDHGGEKKHSEKDHDDHAEEKVPDPHVWHNPQNGGKMVAVIAEGLTQIQPDLKEQYNTQSQTIQAELEQIDQWIKQQVATIPADKKKLVTTHDALGYYLEAYNFEFDSVLSGFGTEESPSAGMVADLVKEIKESQVPTIFAEISVNSQILETVAREANVQLSPRELYTDSLGGKGTEGDSYQKMLIANTITIVKGLGGQYTTFSSK